MIEEEKTKELDQIYEKLFQSGKLFHIHVRKWSMSCQLKKSDIGIETDLALLNLGTRLIEAEQWAKFNSIEQKARNFLKRNSFTFPIAQTYFVPRQKIEEVLLKLREFKGEYYLEKDNFIANYETYKQQALDKYPKYAELLLPRYPTVDQLDGLFSFDLGICEVSFPKEIKELDYEEVLQRKEAKEELKSLYNEELKEQHAMAKRRMEEFVSESVIALRQQVVDVFESISNRIANKEVVSERNIKSIRKLVEDFSALDFFDDKEVTTKLNAVMELTSGGHNFKDNESAIQSLSGALGEALTAAKGMSDVNKLTGEYFRKLSM